VIYSDKLVIFSTDISEIWVDCNLLKIVYYNTKLQKIKIKIMAISICCWQNFELNFYKGMRCLIFYVVAVILSVLKQWNDANLIFFYHQSFILYFYFCILQPKLTSPCSTSGTHHVTLVKNLVTSHEWGKHGIVIATYTDFSISSNLHNTSQQNSRDQQ
jgi:hypothetical protein